MKKIVILSLMLLLLHNVNAQKSNKDVVLKGVLLKKEWSTGVVVSTTGMGLIVERVRIPSDIIKRVVQLNVYVTKHSKEFKTTVKNSSFLGSSFSSFHYAKINSLYSVSVLKGWRYKWARKSEKRGVDVYGSLLSGVVLGFTKPYALRLIYADDDVRTEIYGENNNTNQFLDINNIEGYAGFWKKWNGIRPYPGLTSKAGLLLDYGKKDAWVKNIEIAVAVDLYYRAVPLMALYKNQMIYPRLQISLQLGKRSL